MANNSWKAEIKLDKETITYGFIDEGGEELGDRFFVLVDDRPLPLEFTESICKLCETVTQLIKSGNKPQ